MDWIHCNECFAQPNLGQNSPPGSETLLYLTSCGHIFCGRCKEKSVTAGECKTCKSKCNIIQLVHDMKPEVREFFSEPEELLTKLVDVMDFQKQHRVKLTAQRVQLHAKYEKAKAEIRRLTQISEKLYKDLITVHKENKLLKSTLMSHNNKNTPKPAFVSPAGPCLSQGSRNFPPQLFQSKLVTPLRVTLPNSFNRSGSRFSQDMRGSTKLPASLLTPSSTMSHSHMPDYDQIPI